MTGEKQNKMNYLKSSMGIGCILLYILLISIPTPDGLPLPDKKLWP